MATASTTRSPSRTVPLTTFQQIAEAASLDDLATLVQALCRSFFSAAHVRLAILLDHHDHLHVNATYPSDAKFQDFLPIDWLREAKPVVWRSSNGHTEAPYASEKLSSVLVLPLFARDMLVGMLEIGRKNASRWSQHDLELAQILASQISIAVALFTVQLSTERRNAEISTLNDIAATITSTLDPRQVYRLVVQKINEYFQVEAGSLLLLDQETGELVFVMTLEFGIVSEKLTNVRVPSGQGLVSEAIRTRQPVVVPDVEKDPRFYRRVSEDAGFQTRSVLCVPMLVKGRGLGVIQLLNKVEGEFTEEDAARLTAMANTIAVAIDNATLFQEVSQNRNRLQAILNSTQDAILTIDNDDTVVTANPMVEEFFGLRWQKLVGQSGSAILSQIAERSRPIDDIPGDGEEFEVVRPAHRVVRRVTLPVNNVNNEQIGILIVFHDITQEHELTRMRDDYTGMLVHDLRAPLTAIINGMTMVRRGFAGPINDQQKELLDLANNGSQEMIGMINTLLDISKMESGQMVLNREPCSAYDVVDRAVERIITSAHSANITVRQDLALNLPIIDVDQDKLVRVLQNLLDNAIKFTPLNGEVVVEVSLLSQEFGPEVRWSVIDNGPGIPESYRDRIFDKFVQVGQKKGTGLGLAFAKLTTEAHGGRIWVESIEGQGSTFSFTTPYRSA